MVVASFFIGVFNVTGIHLLSTPETTGFDTAVSFHDIE